MVPERLQPLLDDTAPLAERFAAAGHRLYLVGGSVRDAILGRPLDDRDLDFTTDARPDDIEAILRGWADAIWDQGRRFGTIGARKDGRDYEITTHRAEAYTPDSRKPEVAFADAVEADLARRDFTINAMALELRPAPAGTPAPPEPGGSAPNPPGSAAIADSRPEPGTIASPAAGSTTPTAGDPAAPTAGDPVAPTAVSTAAPTAVSTVAPTAGGTVAPTAVGTAAPTAVGTAAPTAVGTAAQTAGGTAAQTAGGTAAPTAGGTAAPTAGGTAAPTAGGTAAPTAAGSAIPAKLRSETSSTAPSTPGPAATAELIDPFGGLADLAAHRLRTPLSPDESFTDDPLRMLRAARFIAGYGLAPDPELVDAVCRLRGRLEIVSPERIRGELDKLMVVENPSDGLWFLVNTGLSDEFLPELSGLSLEQDPIHRHKDVLAHSIAVVEKTRPDRILRLAALLHDIGKPKTRSIGPQGVSFHHHEVVGARMADTRLRALRYPMDEIADITRLVELHLRFHGFGTGWSDSAVRRYARDAGPLLEKLNELTRCDVTTRNKRRADELARRMDLLEERIAVLREQEELDSIRPDLDGNQIMEQLGIGPSRDVGRARDFLLELRLEEGPLGEDEARRRLVTWWDEQQASNP